MSVERPRSRVIVWREAIFYSELSFSAKGVMYAHSVVLDTETLSHRYSNEKIAKGAGCEDTRTVTAANKEAELAGFLDVIPTVTKGRGHTNTVVARLPEKVHEMHRSEWGKGASDAVKGASDAGKGASDADDLVVDLERSSEERARTRPVARSAQSKAKRSNRDRLDGWLAEGGGAREFGLETALDVLDGFKFDDALLEEGRRRLYALHGQQPPPADPASEEDPRQATEDEQQRIHGVIETSMRERP